MDLSYILNELAEERGNYFNAVAPPIIQSSNFIFNKVDDIRKAFTDEYATESYIYSRGKNPTVDILRKKLAALDNAEDCLVVNSGAAAIFAAVFSHIKTGDHIISVSKPYTWAQKIFDVFLPKFGITNTYIDGKSIENFKLAIRPNTSVIYLESPNSWDFGLQDLKAIAKLAKEKNIITIIDNSYCTPLYQKPIDCGIDISLQTATKYISGHSDTLGGVICGSKKMIQQIFNNEFMAIGSGISPFNAWLLLRGLRTLPIRLEKITATTKIVFEYLKHHPKIETIIFPFDEKFPQYQLAKQQMKEACGLITFVVKTNHIGEVEQFCENLEHIFMAVSWGGYESLIMPKCASINPADFDVLNKEHRMLRLYVGLEEAGYLIKDLEQALEKLQ